MVYHAESIQKLTSKKKPVANGFPELLNHGMVVYFPRCRRTIRLSACIYQHSLSRHRNLPLFSQYKNVAIIWVEQYKASFDIHRKFMTTTNTTPLRLYDNLLRKPPKAPLLALDTLQIETARNEADGNLPIFDFGSALTTNCATYLLESQL